MSKPSVSFIIPYYREDISLLERAVESIVRLGSRADWEVWVVDDGSPGGAAGRYVAALADARVRYLWQENQGLGGARNAGLARAGKEYVQFVDADDYLFPAAALRLPALLAEHHDADFLAFGFRKVRGTGVEDVDGAEAHVLFRGSGTELMLRHNLRGGAWGYVFRRAVLGGLRFTPGIYHEDDEFTPLLLLGVRRAVVTDLPLYAYYQRPGSIVRQAACPALEKRFTDLLGIIVRLDARRRGLEGQAAEALARRTDLLRMAMVYTLMCDSPDARFLFRHLRRMRRAGYYPLDRRADSRAYRLVRLLSRPPLLAAAVRLGLRLLGLRHAGRAS